MVNKSVEPAVPDICDPARMHEDVALSTARRRAAERIGYDMQISQFLYEYWLLAAARITVVERTLRVIQEIAPAPRLQAVLRAALSCQNSRVRSKAALVLGGKIESVPLLQNFLRDPDARVRANAVEILWGRKAEEVAEIFNEALTDLHHRVAANALYGIHGIDPPRCLAKIEGFATHMHPRFRSAAAWVIGKLGDRRNVALLKPLLVDPNPDVRKSASRAVGMLRACGA